MLLYNPLNYHKDNMIFKNVLKDLNIVFISLASLMHGTYTNHKGWLSVILLTIILCNMYVPLYVLTVTCHFLIVTCSITTLNEILLNIFMDDWWINRVRKNTEPAIFKFINLRYNMDPRIALRFKSGRVLRVFTKFQAIVF